MLNAFELAEYTGVVNMIPRKQEDINQNLEIWDYIVMKIIKKADCGDEKTIKMVNCT